MFVIDIRRKLGLTQKQLAKKINVTQGAVSHWECGLSYPCFVAAEKITKLALKAGINCKAELLRMNNG